MQKNREVSGVKTTMHYDKTTLGDKFNSLILITFTFYKKFLNKFAFLSFLKKMFFFFQAFTM